jgi:hypothetical protein
MVFGSWRSIATGWVAHIGLVVLLVFAAAPEASAISLSLAAPQTESGQDFDFEFSSILVSDGSDGVLTIHARGDYQAANPTEFLTWDLDSLGIGSVAGPLTGLATILQDNGVNDVEWTQSFVLFGSDLLVATADSTLHLHVDLNLDELFLGVNHLADTEFVEVSLSYAALPEPTSALMFAMGSLVMARVGARRRS